MQALKIVFFGNSVYSAIGAEIIHKYFPLSAVITTPDRVAGRKKELTSGPVKKWAIENEVAVLEANRLDEVILKQIFELNPDFLIVEDYGLILPEELLKISKFAPLNIHHSLLPKYRGPSPAPTAILNGEEITGVTIIKMTNQVDAGHILAQTEYKMYSNETTDSLLKKLNQLGGELMVSLLKNYIEGQVNPRPQDNSQASYTKKFSKEDGYFDIDSPPSADQFDRMIRAYYPWPTVWTIWRVKEPKSQSVKERIVKFLPGGLVQMEGKKAISLKDFLNGYPDFPLKNL